MLACQTVAPRHAAHACGAADARLTDCAREGLRRAGRDAGTGALNRTQELLLKKKKGGRNLQGLRLRRQIYALPDRRLHLKEIWMAEDRADAEKAFGRFLAKYEAKYDKATACLAKDREALLAFYDFPAEHWKHIRTSNPIESTFATVGIAPRAAKAASRTRPA